MICAGLIFVMFCKEPVKPVVVVTGCARIEKREIEWQRRLNLERKTLAIDSAVRSALNEWLRLRDQARKCRSLPN